VTAETDGYYVELSANTFQPEDGGDATFVLSGCLRRRGRRPRPEAPLREESDPVVLECAAPVLQAFAEEALVAGYQLRVDVSKAAAAAAPWPRWCRTGQQYAGLLGSLAPRPGDRGHMSIYPVSMWFLPPDSATAEDLVETFRTLPMDDAVFSEVLRAGIFRIALDDAFFDLLADPSLEELLTGWMKRAVQAVPGTRVEWEAPDS
jgi:hypothetical protein